MKTLNLKRDDIYRGALVLVNARYPLRNRQIINLIPAGLCFPNILMRREAANVLQLILEDISAGNFIVPVSGYRSFAEQTAIYENSLRDNGRAFTEKYVALPDHSEHQTGLAIDLGLNQEKIDFIRPDFPYDGICGRFRAKAPNYGFIERYRKSKETITGISHEPWHFRYVGYPHSKIIEDRGFSLEEYIEFIKDYREDCPFVYRPAQGIGMEIYYIPARKENTQITVPENCTYQLSGNNTDGFIMTVWRRNDD